MLNSKGILSTIQKRILISFSKLEDSASLSLKRVNDFPDEIERWPVEMIAPVKVIEIKDLFSSMLLKIMNKIQKSKEI